MKKLLFGLIFVVPFIQAKENKIFALTNEQIQGSNELRLKQLLEQKKIEGFEINIPEASKSILKERLKGVATDAWVDQVLSQRDLPAAQGLPGGTSGSTGMGSGSGLSGVATGSAGSGIDLNPPAAPQAPSAPGAPEGSASGTVVPEKPLVITARKPEVPELTDEQLKSLPDSDKQLSDEVVTDAFKQIAQIPLTAKFVNAVKAALQDTIKKPAMRNKKIVGASLTTGGSFEKFTGELKDAQMSGELYDDLSTPASSKFIKMLANIFQSYLLKEQLPATAEQQSMLFDVVLNMALSLRPINSNPAEGAQIISDSQVATMLGGLIASIKADAGFAAFVKATADASAKKLEKGQKEEVVIANLAQDFLKVMLRELKRLLIQPKFLKIADKTGNLGGKGTILAPDGLLNSLLSDDPNSFNIRRVRGAMADQLYFEAGRLDEFFKENDHETAVKALLSDHASRLRSIVLTAQDFLNKELAAIKAVRDLKGKLQLALARVTFKNDQEKKLVNDMIANLDAQPDPKVIGDGLKALNVELSLISKVKKVITDESKKFDIQTKVKEILMQAKDAAKNGKVDALLNEKLKPLLNPYQGAALAGVERTIDSAYGVLIALMGKVAVEKIVTIKEFNSWIYEYGLLMILFKNLQTEAKGMKSQDMIDKLLASLIAMNTAEIKANVPYFSIINDPRYRPSIEAGLYKGKLADIIAFVGSYNLVALRDALRAFVAKAGIGVENYADFAALADSAIEILKKAMLEEIVRQLQILNSGSGGYQVKGLELSGKDAGRNALVYDALKAAFKNQENAVRAGIDKVDLAALRAENVATLKTIRERLDTSKDRDMQKLGDDQKKSIVDAWQAYLGATADKLEVLKKSAQQAQAQPESESTGVPTAPEAPGAPEAPMAPAAPQM